MAKTAPYPLTVRHGPYATAGRTPRREARGSTAQESFAGILLGKHPLPAGAVSDVRYPALAYAT